MAQKSHKPRALTQDERQLWQKVAEKTEPLVVKLFSPIELPIMRDARLPAPVRLSQFQVGSAARSTLPTHVLTPDLDTQFASVSPNMDKKNFDRLKKGKLKIDGRIDLHGMTQSQAHPALLSYINTCDSDGKRLILVITGKGKKSEDQGVMPARRGVLKHLVPQWLQQANIAHKILQITQAQARHGGSGAYYVYLRRRR